MTIKQTNLLLLVLMAFLVIWGIHFEYSKPKFSVGDCIIHKNHDPSRYEDWEIPDFDKITYYRIEEIGKKKYRIGVAKAPSYWKDMNEENNKLFINDIKHVDDIYIKADCP